MATNCDYGNVKAVVKRSTDGGRTWSSLTVVASLPGGAVVNTSPIVDKDTVHVLFALNNTQAWYTRSTDEGVSWSVPVNLTSSLEPGATGLSNVWYAPGPSGGVTSKDGKLITVARGPFANNSAEILATLVSADNGATFGQGSVVPIVGQEPSISRFGSSDSELVVISRRGSGLFGLAFSGDHGVSWDVQEPINLTALQLHVPDCQGSILGVPGTNRLLLGTPTATDTKGRSGFRVLASDDRGASWRVHLTLTSGDWSTGYSSLLALSSTNSGLQGDVACLFESRVCQSPLFCNMGISLALFSSTENRVLI